MKLLNAYTNIPPIEIENAKTNLFILIYQVYISGERMHQFVIHKLDLILLLYTQK